jgi:hypothetical protein
MHLFVYLFFCLVDSLILPRIGNGLVINTKDQKMFFQDMPQGDQPAGGQPSGDQPAAPAEGGDSGQTA